MTHDQSDVRRRRASASPDDKSDFTGQGSNSLGATQVANGKDVDDQYSSVAPSQHRKGLGVKGNRDAHGREIPDSTKYLYSYADWRPTSDKETLAHCYENNEGMKDKRFKVFVDNPPTWNPKT